MGQDNSKQGVEYQTIVGEEVLEMQEIATAEEVVEKQAIAKEGVVEELTIFEEVAEEIAIAEEVVEEMAIAKGGIRWPSLPLVEETATAEESMEEATAGQVDDEKVAFVVVVDGVAEVVEEMSSFDIELRKAERDQPEVKVLENKVVVKDQDVVKEVAKEVVKELEQKLEKLGTLNRLEEAVASLRVEKGEVLGKLAEEVASVQELAAAAVARCRACAAVLAAPVYQCKAGHKVCSGCRERAEVVRRKVLGRKRPSCPSCSSVIIGRDEGLEELVARVAAVLEQI